MESSKEEHMKCHICLEFYTKPRALPCLHSFCESCLQEYIDKNTSLRRKEFACPVCGKTALLPSPDKNRTEWAASFPLNFTLASIVDSSQKEREVPVCDPCKFEQKKVVACNYCVDCKENLCSECTSFHKKTQILRSHKVVQLEEKEDVLISKPLLADVEKCSCRRQKEIEIFCTDHDEFSCAFCATVKHRKCKEVKSISDMDKMLLRSGQLDEFLEEMATSLTDCKNISTCLEKNEKELDKDKQRVISSVRNERNRIVVHLDKLVKHMVDETEANFKHKEANMKEQLHFFKEISSDIHVLMATLKHDKENGQIPVYYKFKKAEWKKKEIDERMKKKLSNLGTTHIEFELDSGLSCLERNVNSFGTLRANSLPNAAVDTLLNRLTVKETNVEDMSVTVLRTFNAKTNGDAWSGNISGICVVSTDKLVLADETNGKVKLFEITGKCLHYLKIYYPWDVTSAGTNTVVVTCNKGLQLLSIYRARLIKTRFIPIHSHCLGVTFNSQELTVTCHCPPSVQVFSMEGTLKRTIHNPRFKSPQYVAFDNSENLLIVTDCGHYRGLVLAISRNGEEMFSYKGIKGPLGVTMDKRGTLFICGFISSQVHAISPRTGKKLKVVLSRNEVHRPQTIVYNENTDTFFLTFDEDSEYTYEVWEIRIN